MDIQAIQKVCKELEKKRGVGSVATLGSSKVIQIQRWSTGIEELDEILGGGMPAGRIIEIYGPESSGKTSLGYWLCSMVKLALYIPIEGTFDKSTPKRFGVKDKQMIVDRAQIGEEALNSCMQFSKAGIPLIVLDSVAACKPKEDLDKAEKDAAIDNRLGGTARLFEKMLQPLEHKCEVTGTTILLINQIRDNVGAFMASEKTKTPGGWAVKFYSSVRLQVARRAWIEIPNKNPKLSSATEKVGLIMKIKVTKSKVHNPQGICEIPMFFDRGFVSFDDVDSIRKGLMKQRREQYAK